MSDVYTQTDTAAPLGVIQACSPVAPSGDADAKQAAIGGTPGVTAVAAAIPAASKVTAYCDELDIDDATSLDGGTLTHRLNVNTAQASLTLEDIYVCRVNSSGVSQEELGNATGLATDISAGGVFTTPITLSAASAHNPGDKVYVTVAVANSHDHTARSLEVLPNQNIDTPFVGAGTTFEESMAGSLTPSGAETRQAQKVVASSLAGSGLVVRQASKFFAGSAGPSGSLLREIRTAFAGSLSAAGALIRSAGKAMAGSLTGAGELLLSLPGYSETWDQGETTFGTATLDPDVAPPAGAPAWWGTEALRAEVTVQGDSAFVQHKSIVPTDETWTSIGFYIDSHSLADFHAATLFEGRDATFGKFLDLTLTIEGGQLKFQITVVHDNGSGTLVEENASLDTFYLLDYRWDRTANEWAVQLNGSVVGSGDITRTSVPELEDVTLGVLNRQATVIYGRFTISANKRADFLPTGPVLRTFLGALTATGLLSRESQKAVAGSVAMSGLLSRETAKTLVGSLAPSGALQAVRSVVQTFLGSLTAAGALTRRTDKRAAGTSTASGSLTRQTDKGLAGSLTMSGALGAALTVLVTLSGALTAAGTLLRQTRTAFAGATGPTGALTRRTLKSLAGSLAPTGALEATAGFFLEAAGSLAVSGVLTLRAATSYVGSMSPAGALTRRTAKAFAGTVTATGALTSIRSVLITLSGAVTATGELVRDVRKAVTGALTPSGDLTRQAQLLMAGSVLATGALTAIRTVFLAAAGALTMSGALSRRTAKTLAGTIQMSGSVRKRISKLLVGALAALGSLAVTTAITLFPSSPNALGPENVARHLGPDDPARHLGPENVHRHLGPDR